MKLLNRINLISESKKHQSQLKDTLQHLESWQTHATSTNWKRLVRDQVVVGVREEGSRQKLLEDKQLALDKCMSIGRVYGISKQQLQSMSSEGD